MPGIHPSTHSLSSPPSGDYSANRCHNNSGDVTARVWQMLATMPTNTDLERQITTLITPQPVVTLHCTNCWPTTPFDLC
jgi:hypothetical protein